MNMNDINKWFKQNTGRKVEVTYSNEYMQLSKTNQHVIKEVTPASYGLLVKFEEGRMDLFEDFISPSVIENGYKFETPSQVITVQLI